MSVVNVKVKYIRPTFSNLQDWCNNNDNIYIGRKGIVFINNKRYPPDNSIFANPFKIGIDGTREEVLVKYREWLQDSLSNATFRQALLELKGKNLGCWCAPEPCHGDILLEVLGKL